MCSRTIFYYVFIFIAEFTLLSWNKAAGGANSILVSLIRWQEKTKSGWQLPLAAWLMPNEQSWLPVLRLVRAIDFEDMFWRWVEKKSRQSPHSWKSSWFPVTLWHLQLPTVYTNPKHIPFFLGKSLLFGIGRKKISSLVKMCSQIWSQCGEHKSRSPGWHSYSHHVPQPAGHGFPCYWWKKPLNMSQLVF